MPPARDSHMRWTGSAYTQTGGPIMFYCFCRTHVQAYRLVGPATPVPFLETVQVRYRDEGRCAENHASIDGPNTPHLSLQGKDRNSPF